MAFKKYQVSVRENSLELENLKSHQKHFLEFPPNIVSMSTVLDPKQFEKMVVEFFAKHNVIKKQVFLSLVSKDSEKIHHQVGKILSKLENKVSSHNLRISKTYEKPLESMPTNSPKSSKYYIIISGILFIALVILIGLNFLPKKVNAPTVSFQNSTPIVISTPSSSPSATPTPTTLPTIQKSDLTVLVLNGSGITGQASKVKALLLENGFANIKTGNNKIYLTTAQISFSDKVSDDIQNQTIALLKTDFPSIEQNQISSPSADIQIITSTK